MSMADTVRPIVLKFGRGIVRNAPHILMGLGTGSSLMALIFAVKDAPKARELWLEAKQNKAREAHPGMDDYTIMHFISQGDLKDCNPTIKETILLTWKVMGPAAAMELIALICFWAAHGIDIRRQAVLAGLCVLHCRGLASHQQGREGRQTFQYP